MATIIFGILAISWVGNKNECCHVELSAKNANVIELCSEIPEKSPRPANVQQTWVPYTDPLSGL